MPCDVQNQLRRLTVVLVRTSEVVKHDISFERLLRFKDPRDVPSYGIAEAAHYLRMPVATLRTWVRGRYYDTERGRKWFEPPIVLPDVEMPFLSFRNLAEAHVLSACRRVHNIPFPNIRTAVRYVSRELDSKHPLIERDFETDGISLFITRLGRLIDATAHGQIVMRQIVEQHLKRLEREDGVVARLYPFTRSEPENSPRTIYIDPRISFGRPVLAANHIPTAAFVERYRAGESIEHLAHDYGCTRDDVEEAIRIELAAAA